MSSHDFQTTGPAWVKYYSAKETYGSILTPSVTDPAAELTPAFWHNVTALFQSCDSAFQGYIARKTRGFEVESCTGDCKTEEICGLRAAQSQFNCGVLEAGIHFSKRGEELERSLGHVEKDVCEGSLARPILAKIIATHGLLEEGYEKAQQRYRG
jgi:sphingomyelin phosphodiesterase